MFCALKNASISSQQRARLPSLKRRLVSPSKFIWDGPFWFARIGGLLKRGVSNLFVWTVYSVVNAFIDLESICA